jgi:hypothetical protein
MCSDYHLIDKHSMKGLDFHKTVLNVFKEYMTDN